MGSDLGAIRIAGDIDSLYIHHSEFYTIIH